MDPRAVAARPLRALRRPGEELVKDGQARPDGEAPARHQGGRRGQEGGMERRRGEDDDGDDDRGGQVQGGKASNE